MSATRPSAATALLACLVSLQCGAATTPDGPEYPALVLPARLPEPDPNAPARRAGNDKAPATAAPSPQATTAQATTAQATTAQAAASQATSEGAEAASGAGSNPSGTTPLAGDPRPQPGAEPGPRSAHGDLPDPQPLSQRAQWSYPITYDRGTITAGLPELVCLPRPQATARRIGRFAFELWLGRELVDRVRFDFPLLATETPAPASPRPIHDTPRFAPGARVSVVLRVPASERATRASILDRATGEVLDVTWPPRAASGAPLARECPAPPARR